MLSSLTGLKRVFEITGGDKDPLEHRTIALTTCATGQFGYRNSKGDWISLCPSPVVIYKDGKKGKKIVTTAMTSGLLGDDGKPIWYALIETFTMYLISYITYICLFSVELKSSLINLEA
jgi:hypothetical protein